MHSKARPRSPSLPPPPPLDLAFDDSFAMESTDFTITRRSTRSFVESELDANLRELNAVSASDSMSNHGSAPVDINSQQATREATGVSTGTSSSCASTVSSSASSSYVPSTTSFHNGIDMVRAVQGLNMANSVNGNEGAPEAAVEAADDIPTPPGAPVNFGFVMPGIFRSSYPKPENFEFLSDLDLKTIVYVWFMITHLDITLIQHG